jgi:hypothetical protein
MGAEVGVAIAIGGEIWLNPAHVIEQRLRSYPRGLSVPCEAFSQYAVLALATSRHGRFTNSCIARSFTEWIVPVVPAEIVIFTEDEWESLSRTGGRFARMLNAETVWVSKPP